VSDCLEFLPTDSDSIKFFWLSESSGYRHIHFIEATPPVNTSSGIVPRAQCSRKLITHGEWNVLGPKVSALGNLYLQVTEGMKSRSAVV